MSAQVPPERVPPIANEVASNKKLWLALLLTAIGFITIGAIIAPTKKDSTDVTSIIIGLTFWGSVLFALCAHLLRGARRAAEAARLAAEGNTTFVLSGRELIAYDPQGVAIPRASFKMSRRQHTMLTALPKAELRS